MSCDLNNAYFWYIRAAMAAQRVQSEVQVDLGGGAQGSVESGQASLEQILKEATAIWGEVRRSGVDASDDDGNDQLLKTLQGDHKDFATSYPIPFRWMVQAREYDAGTFERWLKKSVKVMYKDRHEFLESQGEYLISLYRTRNPRAPASQVARYGQAIQKSLAEDDETFTQARDQVADEVEKLDAKNDADRRQRILAYLQRAKAERESAADET